MDTITYHKAGVNDIQTLIDQRIMFAVEYAGEQPQKAVDQLKAQMKTYFLKAIPAESCISFIAKSGEEVAGVGTVQVREQPGNFKNPSGRWGYIMGMYTVPAFRRKGICTGLLNALTEEAAKHGITALELHATPKGEMVYTQNGFELYNEPTYRKYIHL